MVSVDGLAYDGNIIVKRTTYGRSSRNEQTAAEVDRIKRAIAMIDKETDSRLTIDALDLSSPNSLEFQVAVNKEVVAELRKVVIMLKTFVANNGTTIDNQ